MTGRPYTVPSYVYQSFPSVRVGADAAPVFKPIREEPNVVVQEDISNYVDLIAKMAGSLKKDAFYNLVWANPLELESDAMTSIHEAEELDGCHLDAEGSSRDLAEWYKGGAKGCPILTDEEDADLGPGETKRRVAARTLYGDKWKAKEKRYYAKMLTKVATDLRTAGAARKMKTPPPSEEADLYNNISDLFTRVMDWWKRYDRVHLVNVDEFREVQAMDLDTQKLRYKYQQMTGYSPSLEYPSYIPGAESKGPIPWIGQIPWTPILIVGGIAAAAALLGQVRGLKGFFRSDLPAASVAPTGA